MMIVEQVGLASTIQDTGRPGYAHLGVPAAGSIDPDLAALTNRLIGNHPGAAVIETAGGLVLRAEQAVRVVDTVELAPRVVRAGERYVVGQRSDRFWTYVAIEGDLDAPAELGSRSTDTLSGIGPKPLAVGQRIEVTDRAHESTSTPDVAPLAPLANRLRISRGPRADWFDDASIERLCTVDWRISTVSRVGAKLFGGVLDRVESRRGSELASEGLVRGAIQVPPNGQPVVMLADHPVTGGYPVVAVVHPDDVALLAHHAGASSFRFADRRGG